MAGAVGASVGGGALDESAAIAKRMNSAPPAIRVIRSEIPEWSNAVEWAALEAAIAQAPEAVAGHPVHGLGSP